VLWFAQIESAFTLSKITKDESKFRYVICYLEETALSLISDVIETPPIENKYETIKQQIIGAFVETNETRLRKLLRGSEIADEKPSHILRKLRNLVGGQCNEVVIKTLFLEQLLAYNLRSILAICEGTELTKLVQLAVKDKVFETSKPNVAQVDNAAKALHIKCNNIVRIYGQHE